MLSVLAVLCCTLVLTEAASFRVVGGIDATMFAYPSMVSLRIQRGQHFCGGTLLNSRTVLTATHCVYRFRYLNPSDYVRYGLAVVLGDHVMNTFEGMEKYRYIADFVYPSAYNHENAFMVGNDIALIKLASPVELESHIKLVNIPQQDEQTYAEGDKCTVVGWGSIDPSATKQANVLQKGEVEIISNNECAAVFSYTRNNPRNMCTKTGQASTSACTGDSGGPLFCQVNGQQVQVGIVSYGKVPCGQRNKPTVYTRVSHYVDWINENKF